MAFKENKSFGVVKIMYNYIFPMVYLFDSRLKSKIERTSWFIIYVIPVFTLSYALSPKNILEFSVLFILAIFSFFSLYEVGYIENDIKTTINESNPTIRIENEKQIFLRKNYYFIQNSKIIVMLILLFFANFVSNEFEINLHWLSFISCLVFIRIAFYAHNRFRNRLNILTFLCLSIGKYFSPILLFLPLYDYHILFVLTFFMFPFLRTLEHATKPKYNLPKLIKFLGNLDIFRVKYYFVMFLSSLVVFFIFQNYHALISVLVMAYFLIYRSSALFFISKKSDSIDTMRKNRYLK